MKDNLADAWLGRLAGAAIIGLCGGTVLLVTLVFRPDLRERLNLWSDDGVFQVGDTMRLRHSPSTHKQVTLAFFVKSTCPACTSSIPTLKRIVSSAATSASGARVVMVALRDDTGASAFAAEVGIESANVLVLSADEIPVRVVPQLVLLSREQQVLFAVTGQPSKAEEERLLALIRSETP